ncbi:MAG: ABC transporter permease [Rhizobiales bacterium]|nr:ABC transporter permease [Hyphomicrobiales bacterium]
MPLTSSSTIASVETSSNKAQSEQYSKWKRQQTRRRWFILATQLAILVVFVLAWEISARQNWINPMLTSYPSAVWAAFMEMLRDGSLWAHVYITVQETIVSFVISMVIGVMVATLLWLSPFLYSVLDPFIVVGNALPKIALVPIFYIWLGPELSIYGVAIAISVVITILMVYSGFCQTDPAKLKLARTFGATRFQELQKVVLPSNLLTIVAALKANVGLALVGVIVGEFQSSKAGLGYLILYGSQIFKMDMVMMSIVILGVLSLLVYLIIQNIEAALLRRRRR